MTIQPVNHGSTRGAGPAESGSVTGRPPVEEGRGGPGGAADNPSDRVEISPEARALQEPAGAPNGRALSPERLREVLGRLAQGFYDRPEVLDAVARGVADELGLPDAGG